MMLLIRMIPKVFIMLPALILVPLAMIAILVLFIKLCYKRPSVAGVVILLPVLLLASYFLVRARPFEHWREVPTDWNLSSSENGGASIVQINSSEVSVNPSLPQSENAAAIWTPGIEDEFEADVYPSMKSAVRGIGSDIDKYVLELGGDVNRPAQITIFQEACDHQLIQELKSAIRKSMPELNCATETDLRNLDPNEVGITMWVVGRGSQAAPWANSSEVRAANGIIQSSVFTKGKNVLAQRYFIEKPWIEDFSGFLNTRPNSRFIVAKSSESCVTEAEANNQAVQNACAQVAAMLGRASVRKSGVPVSFARPVTSADIIEGGFILDRFVQSFEGTAGKIWRQALLLDASTDNLKNLAVHKAAIAEIRRRTFAGMFFSVAGLILLITLVYAFLNAATKGYYTWSLRIAGVVFALVLIILLVL